MGLTLLPVFVLGAVAGSFANVVIHRVPKGASIVKPGSACPACGHRLSAGENVPLVSFLVQRGRCRGCGGRISPRYVVVEILVGSLWVLTFLRIGLRPQLPAYLLFVTALVVLSAIDLEVRRLPNKVLGPGFLGGLVLLAAASAASGQWAPLGGALAGALAYGIPMLGLAIAVPAGMGMGDVKFAGYLGLHLGFVDLPHVAVGAFAGFFLGAFAGVAMMAAGKKGRKETIPFGPAMAAGAATALFWGRPVLRFWLG